MTYRLLILTFLLCLAAMPARAGSAPVPARKQNAETLELKLEEERRRKLSLEEKMQAMEDELERTRGNLVDIGKSIRGNESSLRDLETRIGGLQKEKAALEKRLEEDRHSIARLVLALERIRRVPPQALILRPDAPYNAAQSALLMGDIIPTLNRQAEALSKNLRQMEELKTELQAKRESSLEKTKTLKQEHSALSALVEKRQTLYSNTHKDLKSREQEIRRISAQAENLQDLLKRLEENQAQDAAPAPARKAFLKLPGGPAQLPVSGIIRVRYDEPDNFGAPSKGITIEGRAGALVVAPMGGVVRFAGSFKNYGNMLILEHEKGYHSLIAGLEKIDTVVGHNVAAGEPIGLLRKSGISGKPALYYELRLKGRPVDPAQKFADLS